MKYICYECRKRFNQPNVVEECIGEYGSLPYYEPFAYCPHCGSDAIGNPEEDKKHQEWLENFKAKAEEMEKRQDEAIKAWCKDFVSNLPEIYRA